MPSLDPSMVQVTPVVTDFLFIQFKDPSWGKMPFHYIISGPGDQPARKGSFRGILVQLRMNFLKAGKYTLELVQENFEPLKFYFEKRNEEGAGLLIPGHE